MDVEVVVGILLDAAQRVELGKHDGGHLELVEQREPPQGIGPGDDGAQLGELALARGLRGELAVAAGQLERRGLDLEAEHRGEARGAEYPDRVVRERVVRDRSQPRDAGVAQAVVRVERRAAVEGQRNRVDGEVAVLEVGLDALAAQRGDVDVPAAVGRLGPPRVEALRERERGASRGLGDAARDLLLLPGDGEVNVDHGPAEQRVAQRAADDPRVVARAQRLADGRHGRRAGERIEADAHGS